MRVVWPSACSERRPRTGTPPRPAERLRSAGRACIVFQCAFALLFSGVPAGFAQEQTRDTVDDVLPVEQREELTLGFAQLSPEDVPPEFRYIARSLPLVLLNELEGIPERVRTSGELRAVAVTLLADARSEVAEEIAALVEQRDALLFQSPENQSPENRGETERARINQQLAEQRELLRRLRAASPAQIVRRLDTRMPLSTVRHSEEQPLYPEETLPGDQVDLLVGGQLRYEDEYLVLELRLVLKSVTDAEAGLPRGGYTRTSGESAGYVARQPLASTIVRPEDALNELEELREDIISGILNRPFSRLQVDVEPPSASVSLDGSLVGFGTVSLPYLEPDAYELLVSAAGFREYVREVELTESEMVGLNVDLTPRPAESVTIRSEPGGADLYVGSEWVGRTPVTLDRPSGPRTAELSMEGFRRSRFVLEDRGPDALNRVLAPDTIDLADELRDRREGFYRGLGWLAVSLPIPLIFSGIWQNRADFFVGRQQSMSISEQERFLVATSIIDGVRWGGVALSAGLLVNSIVQAVRYIRASRYYHVE